MGFEIRIARDFSTKPAGRFREDGPNTGEAFREDFLVPALDGNDVVVVVLDGTKGYPAPFREEAFGRLLRSVRWSTQELEGGLLVRADSDLYRAYRERALN